MQTGSVLDTARVRALLAALPAADREHALSGLALLAAAASRLTPRRWNLP